MREPPVSFRHRVSRWAARNPRRAWAIGGVLVLLVAYPFAGGALAQKVITSQLSSRLGVPVGAARTFAGLGFIHMKTVVIGGGEEGRAPLATVARVDVPFSAVWGGGAVKLVRPIFEVDRGGPQDNVSAVLAKLEARRARKPAGGAEPGGGKGSASGLPAVVIEEGMVRVEDGIGMRSLRIEAFDARIEPNERLVFDARRISGRVRLSGSENDPVFGAARLEIDGRLEGLSPALYPTVKVDKGYVTLLPTLPLTGITGTLRPGKIGVAGATPPLEIDLAGSYGGARRQLFTARGAVKAPRGDPSAGLDGNLSVRAERFTLDRIADVLPVSILKPKDTSIDAAMDLKFEGHRVGFAGSLEVTGLNVNHVKIASEPIYGLAFSMKLDGAVDPRRRRLEVTRFEGRMADLVGQVSGAIELAPGTFKHTDGTTLAALPKIDLRVRVPRLPCAKLLASIPGPMVSRLQGFQLQGVFESDLFTKIDYANLHALELGGKVAIGGCKVLKAPDEVNQLAGPASIIQMVEVPPKLGDNGPSEQLLFPIGPDNPDFVPFENISPHIINSIMTTEDGGFFKHRGWVSPEFKTALRRNLERGGFRYGASSITMQMVKNVLLAHEKTLSRKLQELFLVWYIEQFLPKERILELYFNAIEFGPRIYGIGTAARHYFGKSASEITPLEAAFFSSILPSPKRRYIHYCAGALNDKWDKYVRRILNKIYQRGRLTEEEYQEAAAGTITFDVTARGMNEKQCLDWVKKITARPEPEPEPEQVGD